MTRLDALYEERAYARGRLLSVLHDVKQAVALAEMQIAHDRVPSASVMRVKTEAVAEAARMWDATRTAVTKAEIDEAIYA